MLSSASVLGGLGLSGCYRNVDIDIGESALSVTRRIAEVEDNTIVNMSNNLTDSMDSIFSSVTRDIRSHNSFSKKILLDQDYDLYVGLLPPLRYPEDLLFLFHSNYALDIGWANQFGITNPQLDTNIEKFIGLNYDNDNRQQMFNNFLNEFEKTLPIIPLFNIPEWRIVRTPSNINWNPNLITTRSAFLTDRTSIEEFNVGVSVPTPVVDLNPFRAQHVNWPFTDLIHDSLMTETDEKSKKWLAETVSLDEDTITVTLKDDIQFHNGDPITVDDVAFTYRLINDLSYDTEDINNFASPRYKLTSLMVDTVETEGDVIKFHLSQDPTKLIGEDSWKRILYPSIISKDVWEDEFFTSDFFDTSPSLEDYIDQDGPTVGSGLYRVKESSDTELLLEKNNSHFYDKQAPIAEKISVTVEANQISAIELVKEGDLNAVLESIRTENRDYAEEIVNQSENITLLEDSYGRIAHIGFNARNDPFSNVNFRTNIGRLIDISQVVSDAVHDSLQVVKYPIPRSSWYDDITFPENNEPITTPYSSVEEAIKSFEEIGYKYQDGKIVI